MWPFIVVTTSREAGQMLDRAIRASGLKADYIAAHLGVSAGLLSMWRAGERQPSLFQLARMPREVLAALAAEFRRECGVVQMTREAAALIDDLVAAWHGRKHQAKAALPDRQRARVSA